MIQNPILRGFNPDPSIIRVGNDYYIATSTFEWFPGVQIHHSTDLQNWKVVARPLNRLSQLDMVGVPDSCGVWAPCLSYHKGTFYLVYSNVKSFDGVWKDTPNFLVKTQDILGDWSEPIFLGSHGFDGSLFHDDDGRKWYTSMLTDHRKGKFFGGVILQEFDEVKGQLIGNVHHIFAGSELGITEAPHLYKRNGFYYLITAEGGTEYGHAVSFARSKKITGPYELHPQNPIITARNHPEAPLQKCGHADLVETKNGDWYAVFLVGRPLSQHGRCTLGRETAIEEMEWREDDWLYLKNKGKVPRIVLPFNPLKEKLTQTDHPNPKKNHGQNSLFRGLEDKNLNEFQSLRIPITEDWCSTHFRPNYLRLFGRESLTSLHYQSLIARRVQHFNIEVETCLEFQPTTFQQMAGLVAYYNTGHWFYLHIMGDEDGKSQFLQLISCDNFEMKDILATPINITKFNKIFLKLHFNQADLQFYFATEENKWQKIGGALDGSILSDDYVRDGNSRYRPAFTGSFVGLCCQDLTGQKQYADFAFFNYTENLFKD